MPDKPQPPPLMNPWLITFQQYLVVALVAMCFSLVMFNLAVIPVIHKFEDMRPVRILTVTAYSPRVQETDATPFINAWGKSVDEGQIAVSRDLFLSGWTFGRKVWIQGEGIFVVSDLMGKKRRGRPTFDSVDIFMFSTRKALRFGKLQRIVALLGR